MIFVTVNGIFDAGESWVDVLSVLHEKAEAEASELLPATFCIDRVTRESWSGTPGSAGPVTLRYEATFEVRG